MVITYFKIFKPHNVSYKTTILRFELKSEGFQEKITYHLFIYFTFNSKWIRIFVVFSFIQFYNYVSKFQVN